MKKTFDVGGVELHVQVDSEIPNGNSAETVLELSMPDSLGFGIKVNDEAERQNTDKFKLTVFGDWEGQSFLGCLKFAAQELQRKIFGKFTFSQALELMKDGARMTRLGWNGVGMTVQIQFPDEHSANTLPYIYMVIPAGSSKQFGEKGNQDNRVPWLASQTDMLAEDWVEII